MQKKLQALELQLAKVERDLNFVTDKLADPNLYVDDQQDNLVKLTQQREKLQEQQHSLEHEWFDISKQLDMGE